MEDFVPFEIAKKLKEKGFKEKCYAYYSPVNNELRYNIYQFRGGSLYDCLYSYNSLPKEVVSSDSIDAPTISQVLKWLREEKRIHIVIVVCSFGWLYDVHHIETGKSLLEDFEDDIAQSYEVATLAGIEYVLDNLI